MEGARLSGNFGPDLERQRLVPAGAALREDDGCGRRPSLSARAAILEGGVGRGARCRRCCSLRTAALVVGLLGASTLLLGWWPWLLRIRGSATPDQSDGNVVAGHDLQLWMISVITSIGSAIDGAEKLKSAAESTRKAFQKATLTKTKEDAKWDNYTLNETKFYSHGFRPEADLNDGNTCADDEELLGILCYKKCSEFHGGKYPIRLTAFSCCSSTPCGFSNTISSSPFGPCDGFSVSGDSLNNACPHQEGGCLRDEELCGGFCMKKCILLTNATYPYRKAPTMCCKYDNTLLCADASNTYVSSVFAQGGGNGDGRAWTPSMMHPPLGVLTET